MASDDKLTAALAEIRERGYQRDRNGAAAFQQSDNAARDVPRLLAAVDKALKLADEAIPVDRDYGGEPIWWNLTPEAIREAITSALTGEGNVG